MMINELKKVEYNGVLVLTTQQIAKAYEIDTNNIKKNFSRNKDRYVEGKHYICLKGDELRDFKAKGQIVTLPNINTLYLWTKKGAFLHAKSLNTYVAWEVYDRLVDDYFDKRKDFDINNIPNTGDAKFLMCLQGLKFVADDMQIAKSSRLFMYNGVFHEFGLPTSFLPHYEDNGNRERCSATELLNRNNCVIKTAKFNQMLISAGYLEIKERKSSKGTMKQYKSLTDKGQKYGVNLISDKNQKETQPYYYADTFMELYQKVV